MKFFIPAAKTPEDAAHIFEATRAFAKQTTGWDIEETAIYRLAYNHEGKSYVATVGEQEPREGGVVVAILKSTTYLVCTGNRGAYEARRSWLACTRRRKSKCSTLSQHRMEIEMAQHRPMPENCDACNWGLSPVDAIRVQPIDRSPVMSRTVDAPQILDQYWWVHQRCFDPYKHHRAD
jgi:hypothetical protein